MLIVRSEAHSRGVCQNLSSVKRGSMDRDVGIVAVQFALIARVGLARPAPSYGTALVFSISKHQLDGS